MPPKTLRLLDTARQLKTCSENTKWVFFKDTQLKMKTPRKFPTRSLRRKRWVLLSSRMMAHPSMLLFSSSLFHSWLLVPSSVTDTFQEQPRSPIRASLLINHCPLLSLCLSTFKSSIISLLPLQNVSGPLESFPLVWLLISGLSYWIKQRWNWGSIKKLLCYQVLSHFNH